MTEQILKLFNNNQFLTGGFILGVLGGIAVYFKTVPTSVYFFLKRRFLFRVEIENHLVAFKYFDFWIRGEAGNG